MIEFIYAGRPEYNFEAKRLFRPGFPASKYLGRDGLGCFLDGRYARAYHEAGMLGYVQSDSVAWWADYLKARMEIGAPITECFEPWAFHHEWKTSHGRSGSTMIDIYHILLDCR